MQLLRLGVFRNHTAQVVHHILTVKMTRSIVEGQQKADEVQQSSKKRRRN